MPELPRICVWTTGEVHSERTLVRAGFGTALREVLHPLVEEKGGEGRTGGRGREGGRRKGEGGKGKGKEGKGKEGKGKERN